MANNEYKYWYRLELKSLPEPETEDELNILSERPEAKPLPQTEPIAYYFNSRMLGIRQSIDQINEEIASRKHLMGRSLEQVDYQIGRAASNLGRLVFRIGYNRSVDMTRNTLERELANLRRERRATRLRFWEDVVQLRHELREVTAEYRDTLRKMDIASEGDEHGD